MRVLVRSLVLAVAAAVGVSLAGVAPEVRAANPKQIDTAIQRGMGYLKEVYKGEAFGAGDQTHDAKGVGAAALAGLALLEGGCVPNDPSLVNIHRYVRRAAFTQNFTYPVSLSLMFLERMGDPADVPIVQMLAVRLMAGHLKNGAWSYETCGEIPEAEGKRLEAAFAAQPMGLAPGQAARQLHPEVVRHAQAVAGSFVKPEGGGDNSNTQFGLLALWIARRHAVPAEENFVRIEQRFLATQAPDGTWEYQAGATGTPSMICVGIMGLATGVGRQQERKLRAEANQEAKTAPAAKGADKDVPRTGDLFFTPAKKEDPRKAERIVVGGGNEAALNRAFNALGRVLATTKAQGRLVAPTSAHGEQDLYFLWCVERVGVIFGRDRIGGLDWYEEGADALVRLQSGDGSWNLNGYPAFVNTSFAVLFLSKSNVVRDLSSKIAGDTAPKGKAGGKDAKDPLEKLTPAPEPETAEPGGFPDNEAGRVATGLIGVTSAEWKKTLDLVRDAKGSHFTGGIALAIGRLDGDRLKDAREALAERLTRMTATNLRAMLKADDPEVRRAAALACGMKDDKAHVADLIDRLTDQEEYVGRAALASLKSLTGQDHGPPVGATNDQRKAAADAWKAAWAKKK